MRKQIQSRKQYGFSILEVVIGIFIFTVGLLAMAALQGALTRSMADSKLRTTAVNLADRAIERQRGFTRLLTAVTPGVPHAYNDIVTPGVDPTITLNGVTYTINMDVTDYYYDLASDGFTMTSTGAASSDYKDVEVTVSWNAGQDFRTYEGEKVTSAEMNTGSVKLTATIPALVTSASARVADETPSGGKITPPIVYTPGLNPDVLALALGNQKFKESLTPEPEVQLSDELVQTTFDVITYSSSNGNTFLRREEFAAVSCECTLETTAGPGRRPVIWAGDEYLAGHLVDKTYGVSANNKNSSLCDSCCRDHHDGGSSGEDSSDSYSNVYGPFKIESGVDKEYLGNARASDHKHYQEDGETIAGDGDKYLEACRLVRVDGFFRVSQDFRREDQYIFPEDHFNFNSAQLATYSNYVTGAVDAYEFAVSSDSTYPTNSPPCIGDTNPPCVFSPNMQVIGSSLDDATELPSWTSLVTGETVQQQLRSRGVYIDYMSVDLRSFVANCFDGDGDLIDDCSVGDVEIDKTTTSNILEVLPFFDVQLTKLENWDQSIQNPLPISLTNDPVSNLSENDRGKITQIVPGDTDVRSLSHRGNIGFTNTLRIDPIFETAEAFLNVQSLDEGGSGGGGGGTPPIVIEGGFSEDVAGDPTITVTGNGNVTCTKQATGYQCLVNVSASLATITVSGYEDLSNPKKDRETRYACSDVLVRTAIQATPGNHQATFQLVGVAAGTTWDIKITLSTTTTTTSC